MTNVSWTQITVPTATAYKSCSIGITALTYYATGTAICGHDVTACAKAYATYPISVTGVAVCEHLLLGCSTINNLTHAVVGLGIGAYDRVCCPNIFLNETNQNVFVDTNVDVVYSVLKSSGAPLQLSGASIEWEAQDSNDNIIVTKSTPDDCVIILAGNTFVVHLFIGDIIILEPLTYTATITTADSTVYTMAGALNFSGLVQTVVPTGTTASSVPTISASSHLTQTVVPTCTTASNTPTKTTLKAQTTVPSCTTASLVPPTISITNNPSWVQSVAPTCATTSITPMVTIDTFIQWPQISVPECTAAALAPSVTLINNVGWTQTTVPTCTTASLRGAIVTSVTETTTPNCITASSAPAIQIRLTETTVPNCTTASSDPLPELDITIVTVPSCTTASDEPTVWRVYTTGGLPLVHVQGATLPSRAHRVTCTTPKTSARMTGILTWEKI